MDFWLESAKPWNEICLYVDSGYGQGEPSANKCDDSNNMISNEGICVDARMIADPTQLENDRGDGVVPLGPGEYRGPGCKHDGGPLWISIPLVDDPVVAEKPEIVPSSFFFTNPVPNTFFQRAGGYSMTIWSRIFQRAPKKPVISRKKPRITSYNNPERYEYSNRYESVGRDLFSNSGRGYDTSNNNGNNNGNNNALNSQNSYYPRIGHRSYWSQTESIAHEDEELIECLRIFICETEGSGDFVCIGTDGEPATNGSAGCGNNNPTII